MPMSWKVGSHDTITSRVKSNSARSTIAVMFEYRFPCVILTAFGSAVDPLVNWSSASASSSTSTGSASGSKSTRSVIRRYSMPCSARTGASWSNGSPSSTSREPIIRSTVSVSSAHWARSVRGVGWCSMVTLPPASQVPCTVGAISSGAPASTATAAPGSSPPRTSPPARLRARSCTSDHVLRTGSVGSPVTIPRCRPPAFAVATIVSTNRLMSKP